MPKKKIDLTQVTGTGRDGRITRKDVTNFTPTQARTPEKTVSQELALQFQRSQLLRKMKAPQQLVQLKQPQIKLSLQILYVKQLLKMVQSVNEIPHAWLMVEADVTNLVQLRNSLKMNLNNKKACL